MRLNPQQIQAVINLPGPERYRHFIKRIADHEEVWGLYKDGWALAATAEGEQVFPVWPEEDYALMSAQGEWADYEPASIPLDEFREELLPMLQRDGLLLGVFYTPTSQGVTPEISQVLHDLDEELEKYS